MKKFLLFDLDGTLTDPKEGITSSVQYALRAFGIEEPDLDKLEPFIGPPLRESFMGFYGMNAAQAEEAVAKYRERFQEIGIFENKVYDGIPRMLRRLRSNGMVLAVASSKPQVFVERIMDHFGLRKYFAVIVGSELDGKRESKEEVVQEALNRLFCQKEIRRDQVYMIGDRRFDVEGARAMQIESVGVTYGYGSMEELKEAKADYIVQSVRELESFLMRGAGEESADRAGLREQNIKRGGMMLGSVLLFLLARTLADSVLEMAGCPRILITAVSFLAGGSVIWGIARRFIEKTAEDTKLNHLRKVPGSSYLFLGFATAGSALGLNLLLELLQITAASGEYQAAAAKQYAVPFLGGLIVYGLVSPVAEELLFRGIIHNCLRQMFPVRWAVIISSAVFGLYHMNAVQGIYGFLMGCLIAYAYEYFGKFWFAAAVHMAANVLMFCLAYTETAFYAILTWPVCIGFLLLACVCLWMLGRRKDVL